MEDALRYLGLVQTDPTGPAAVLKYRIYNCGAPGVPELDPPPAYPFDDSPEQTVQAESTGPAQQAYNHNAQQQPYNNQPQAYSAQHQPAHGKQLFLAVPHSKATYLPGPRGAPLVSLY